MMLISQAAAPTLRKIKLGRPVHMGIDVAGAAGTGSCLRAYRSANGRALEGLFLAQVEHPEAGLPAAAIGANEHISTHFRQHDTGHCFSASR